MRWTDKVLEYFGLCKLEYVAYWKNKATRCAMELQDERDTIVVINRQCPKCGWEIR